MTRAAPADLPRLAGQGAQKGAPVGVLHLGETLDDGGDGLGEVAALHGLRRLIGHRVESARTLHPLQQQAGLADAAAPPDQTKPACLLVAQVDQAPHLRLAVQKSHASLLCIAA